MVIIHYEVEYDMNKLVLLNEVRKEKLKNKNKLLTFNKNKSIQKDYNKSYITFKEKFKCFQDKEEFIDLKNRYDEEFKNNNNEKNLNEIIEKIFSLNNNKLTIEFINSIYNDDLSESTKIQYIRNKENLNNNEVIILKDSNYNLRILAEDEYKEFEYNIQFQVKDDQNIAIIISKTDLSNNYNIVSLNKKKKEYNNTNIDGLKENYAKCIIMLNSNIEVPDVYEVKSEIEGENIDCKINIIKSWKYDFKQLFEENMYLLFPLKALDLRKRLLSISEDLTLKDFIKDEIFRFFKEMNRYLNKGKDVNLVTDIDINELNLITMDLLNHFIKDKNESFVDIRRDIEATLRDIVV
jgi:hypothetical protein